LSYFALSLGVARNRQVFLMSRLAGVYEGTVRDFTWTCYIIEMRNDAAGWKQSSPRGAVFTASSSLLIHKASWKPATSTSKLRLLTSRICSSSFGLLLPPQDMWENNELSTVVCFSFSVHQQCSTKGISFWSSRLSCSIRRTFYCTVTNVEKLFSVPSLKECCFVSSVHCSAVNVVESMECIAFF
jgi:hypothetical protein